MLPYYAERFPTVEINYTFYRAPNEKILDGLEHGDARALQADAEGAEADHARRAAARLRRSRAPVPRDGRRRSGPKLGALLFQLPPNLKKDLALFDAFLEPFPPRVCAAFEFRHASWLDEEVYARLRARNLALCVADSEKLSTPVEITADYALLPAARRGLHAGRHRALGRRHPRADVRLRATSSSTSSTKRQGRARSSAQAADGSTSAVTSASCAART